MAWHNCGDGQVEICRRDRQARNSGTADAAVLRRNLEFVLLGLQLMERIMAFTEVS